MAEVKTNGQYVRTEWNVGDIIGAEDLNHLEKRAAYNIIAQDEEPTDTQTVTIDDNTTFTQEEVKTHNQIWINTTVDTLENHQVPEIDDENVSETDTWSSQHMVETFARNDVKNDDASSPITAFTETQKDNIAYNSGTVRDKYLAPLFSASSSYNVGDYVMYNNKLYRCITAIETGGSWSTYSSRFTEVSMGDEVSGLKSDLRNSIATFSYNKQLFNFVYGTWTSAGVKNNNMQRVRIDELVPINNIKILSYGRK